MKAEATLVPFGILEMHWNGTLLDTIDKAQQWAKTMTWKGTRPVVQLLDQVYRTGVRLPNYQVMRAAGVEWHPAPRVPGGSLRSTPATHRCMTYDGQKPNH